MTGKSHRGTVVTPRGQQKQTGIQCECGAFFDGWVHPEGHIESPKWEQHVREAR